MGLPLWNVYSSISYNISAIDSLLRDCFDEGALSRGAHCRVLRIVEWCALSLQKEENYNYRMHIQVFSWQLQLCNDTFLKAYGRCTVVEKVPSAVLSRSMAEFEGSAQQLIAYSLTLFIIQALGSSMTQKKCEERVSRTDWSGCVKHSGPFQTWLWVNCNWGTCQKWACVFASKRLLQLQHERESMKQIIII